MLRMRTVRALSIALMLVSRGVLADPLALLDRNGSYVSVEAYGPNILRITLARDKTLALSAAGYGFVATPSPEGWRHEGDAFISDRMSVEVPVEPRPGPPTQGEKYFAPSLPPVRLTVRDARGATLLEMSGW
jgi:alpha-D-xyloside xylohydrolase